MCSTAQTDHRPLAVAMGCPAGIGPEIIAKAWDARIASGEPGTAACVGGTAAGDAIEAEGLNSIQRSPNG